MKMATNIKILAFVAIFSIVFICVYNPLTFSSFINNPAHTPQQQLVYSTITIIAGVLFILASRWLLIHIYRKSSLTILQYCLWLFGEVVIVATIYSSFNLLVTHDNRNFMDFFRGAITFIPLMLAIPYVVSYLYLSLKDKDRKINKLLASPSFVLPEPMAEHTLDDNNINFCDNKGDLKLSIRPNHVYYAESSSNYTTIHYQNNGKMERLLLRNTMKSVEEQLATHGFARCHRTYIINLKKVQLVRKERDGYYLDMENGITNIPISQTYAAKMVMLFTSK